MTIYFTAFFANPFALLYGAQAVTYLSSAILYRRSGHRDLALCSCASAVIHSALAVMHAATAMA